MRYLLCLLCFLTQVSFISANEEDLLVLLPPQLGDIASIDNESVETVHVSFMSCTDGMLHGAAYKNGVVQTGITGTTSAAKKEIGVQRIFRDKKEISKSKEYFLDKNHKETIVHVHKKYIVSTSREKQTIVPKK